MKADEQTLARSLKGTWREEHLFELAQALERYDLHQAQIERLEARINDSITMLAPDGNASADDSESAAGDSSGKRARTAGERQLRRMLHQQLGVDLMRVPCIGLEAALTIASEIGPDVSRFPTAGHFCSWLNLAPPTRISGDRKIGGKAPKRTNPVGQALREAASTARNDKSVIGATYRWRMARIGKQPASRPRLISSRGSSTRCCPKARSISTAVWKPMSRSDVRLNIDIWSGEHGRWG